MIFYKHSHILDTIITAGAYIIYGNGTVQKQNIRLADAFTTYNDEVSSLRQDMEQLYQDIKVCRKEIDGDKLLRIEPSIYEQIGVSIWPDNMDSDNEVLCSQGDKMCRLLLYFDLTVYLLTTFNSCKGALQELKEYQDLLELAKQISDHIVDPPEPFWSRMIPYNTLRNDSLLNIPDMNHYLFPWYEIWAEEPADTLQRMVDFLVEARLHNKPLSAGGFNPALLAEIDGDKTLLHLIAETVFSLEAIEKTVSHDSLLKTEEAISLRLLHAADQVVSTISFPYFSDDMSQKDWLVSFFIDDAGDPKTGLDYATFRRALCDLSMSRAGRLEILEHFSHYFVQENKPAWCSKILQNWSLNDLSTDIQCVRSIFEQWRCDLKQYSEFSRTAKSELPETDRKPPEMYFSNRDRFLPVNQFPGLQTQPTVYMDDDENLPETITLASKDYGPDLLPLPKISEYDDGFEVSRSLQLLPLGGEEEVLAGFYAFLEKGRLFWAARYIFAKGVDGVLGPEVLSSMPLSFPIEKILADTKQSPDGLKMIILAISPEKDVLENIFADSLDEDDDKPGLDQVLFKYFIRQSHER